MCRRFRWLSPPPRVRLATNSRRQERHYVGNRNVPQTGDALGQSNESRPLYLRTRPRGERIGAAQNGRYAEIRMRCRPRFPLSSLFLITLAVAIALGWYVDSRRRQSIVGTWVFPTPEYQVTGYFSSLEVRADGTFEKSE